MIKMRVLNVQTGHEYPIGFSTEDQALYFFRGRHTTHVPVSDGNLIPNDWTRFLDVLYPTCEHGLSATLCAGDGHYPQDDDGQ